MAIGKAVERGAFVYVYNDAGRQIFHKSKGWKDHDGVIRFTTDVVEIRYGWFIHSYDERGREIDRRAVTITR